MLLSEQTKVSFSQCLVCVRAGEANTIIWPQETDGYPRFRVYIQDPVTGQGAHNNRAIYCGQHWQAMFDELVYMLTLEVAEQYAFDRWITRMET